MIDVVSLALVEDDEVVLEDALIQFNELAEIEPNLFKASFKEIYLKLKPIISKNDYANFSLRQQPLEFLVTIIERKQSVVRKDHELLKDIIETIVKVMIDIDEEIDEEWMRP